MPDQDRLMLFKHVSEGLAFLHKMGLAFLHKMGLMHRDIKPGNMVVVGRKSPEGIIIDFGCSTWEKVSSKHLVGTIAYLAPEVIALKQK